MAATPRFQVSAALITVSFVLLTSNAVGYQMYNASSTMCCNGALQARNGSATACCGAAPFDPSASKCCMGQVVPLPAERGFRHGCCAGADGNVSAFTFDTHACCDGVLLEKPDRNGSYSCRGAELFDGAQFLLCGDALVAREAGRGCCVAEPYSHENETCCSRVERATSALGVTTTTTSFQIHPKPHPGQGCCGTQLYNQSEQVCCDGRVRPRPEGAPLVVCCGDGVIVNYTAEICCNGRILERPSENHTCCEDGVYDVRQEQCCGAEVLRRDDGRACCQGAGRSFDATTEFCCQTEVVPLGANGTVAAEGASCCGEPSSRLFDSSVLSFI